MPSRTTHHSTLPSAPHRGWDGPHGGDPFPNAPFQPPYLPRTATVRPPSTSSPHTTFLRPRRAAGWGTAARTCPQWLPLATPFVIGCFQLLGCGFETCVGGPGARELGFGARAAHGAPRRARMHRQRTDPSHHHQEQGSLSDGVAPVHAWGVETGFGAIFDWLVPRLTTVSGTPSTRARVARTWRRFHAVARILGGRARGFPAPAAAHTRRHRMHSPPDMPPTPPNTGQRVRVGPKTRRHPASTPTRRRCPPGDGRHPRHLPSCTRGGEMGGTTRATSPLHRRRNSHPPRRRRVAQVRRRSPAGQRGGGGGGMVTLGVSVLKRIGDGGRRHPHRIAHTPRTHAQSPNAIHSHPPPSFPYPPPSLPAPFHPSRPPSHQPTPPPHPHPHPRPAALRHAHTHLNHLRTRRTPTTTPREVSSTRHPARTPAAPNAPPARGYVPPPTPRTGRVGGVASRRPRRRGGSSPFHAAGGLGVLCPAHLPAGAVFRDDEGAGAHSHRVPFHPLPAGFVRRDWRGWVGVGWGRRGCRLFGGSGFSGVGRAGRRGSRATRAARHVTPHPLPRHVPPGGLGGGGWGVGVGGGGW